MSHLQSLPADVPKAPACRALDGPRHWCYPDRRRRPQAKARTPSPRGLSSVQRDELVDTLHSSRFTDMAPRQIYATLLTEGTLLASFSTMYRMLGALKESPARRAQRPVQHHVKPKLLATAPHQIWTLDITKLPTFIRGLYRSLFVILDLFSRYVVDWMVSRKENAGLAKHLFTEVLARHNIAADTLIVHQDQDSLMIAHCFAELLSDLGIERSYSRPRVSNDNAFSKSLSKTTKYSPTYLGGFHNPDYAREWCGELFPDYNRRPRNGLALFTPDNVMSSQVEAIWKVRQSEMDVHFAKHPKRYVNGPPKAARPPASVAINPHDGETAETVLARPDAFKTSATSVSLELPEVAT